MFVAVVGGDGLYVFRWCPGRRSMTVRATVMWEALENRLIRSHGKPHGRGYVDC